MRDEQLGVDLFRADGLEQHRYGDGVGRFSPLGLGAFAYLSVNLGEKSDLSLLVGRRAAFFLSFFNFLVGFFSTLDFLVFLAILDFLRLQSRHRGLRCARVKVPNFYTETFVCPKN